MPDAMKAMEELAEEEKLENQENEQPPAEPERPAEEKSEETSPAEPEKAEPAEKSKKEPKESTGEGTVLSREEMGELFEEFGDDPVEEPPPYQPPAQQQPFDRPLPPQSQQQQQAPAIPQDVLQITPHQFMPEGQEFDPMEQHTPGSSSNMAALQATAEQTHRLNVHERERESQEQMARQNIEAMNGLDARMEREKWPSALRKEFWNESTGNPLVLDMLADGFLFRKRQAMYKVKRTRSSGGNGESPAPVTKVPKVIEPSASPDEIKKQVRDDFGGY